MAGTLFFNFFNSNQFIMTQKQIDNLSIIERVKAPTPKFFRILKIVGLALAAVSGTIAGAGPAVLPLIVTKIAGYIAVAAGVATAVSQVTVDSKEE
jgi:hypothetical protein